MLKRTLTGFVILVITALFVFLKQFNDVFFDAFALIIIFASVFEVNKAYEVKGKKSYNFLLYLSAILIWLGCLIIRKLNLSQSQTALKELLVLVFVAIVALFAGLTIDIVMAKKNPKKDGEELSTFEKTKLTMQIFAYPLLPLSFLLLLNNLPFEISYVAIILTFVIAMSTDTFAYLFGRFFGKRKFIEEVSPKKTIAGVIGGFVGSIVFCTAAFFIFYNLNCFAGLKDYPLGSLIGAFSVVAVLGAYVNQLGDLVASYLKRKVGLKDYGNVFPGHGGFMDRVDGQMFVAVLIFVVFAFIFV